jgi:hypothetical protein
MAVKSKKKVWNGCEGNKRSRRCGGGPPTLCPCQWRTMHVALRYSYYSYICITDINAPRMA